MFVRPFLHPRISCICIQIECICSCNSCNFVIWRTTESDNFRISLFFYSQYLIYFTSFRTSSSNSMSARSRFTTGFLSFFWRRITLRNLRLQESCASPVSSDLTLEISAVCFFVGIRPSLLTSVLYKKNINKLRIISRFLQGVLNTLSQNLAFFVLCLKIIDNYLKNDVYNQILQLNELLSYWWKHNTFDYFEQYRLIPILFLSSLDNLLDNYACILFRKKNW